ncbi:GNAT family N-acetyltransferase [Azotobacter vinelandii]
MPCSSKSDQSRYTEIPVFAGTYRNGELRVRLKGNMLCVLLDGQLRMEMTILSCESPTSVRCRLFSVDQGWVGETLLASCEALFVQHPALEQLVIEEESLTGLEFLLNDGVFRRKSDGTLLCEAEQFWQYAPLWLTRKSHGAYPSKLVMTNGIRHPLRPERNQGELYRRFIPWLGQTLSFRIAEINEDLYSFNRWMNNPRVARFWEEQGDLEQHRAYLERQLADPHTLPVIGCFDGSSFGYFEVYWAKEDRIAPFYDVDDYDRGLHLLVGEEAFRGKAFYTAWFSSICHYMFLDDPRTRRIVCEPRHDNHQQIANFDRSGFARIKHFDFPHKRALLVMLWRERFFSEHLYRPL